MAPVELKYLQRIRSHGKIFTYYRRRGRRIPISGQPGTIEFLKSYEAADAAFNQKQGVPRTAIAGTLQALWDDFEASPEYRQVGEATRKAYKSLLAATVQEYGTYQVAKITSVWLLNERNVLYAHSNSQANAYVVAMKRLVNWGLRYGYRPKEGNPAVGIEPLRLGAGHRPWTDKEFAIMSSEKAGALARPVIIARYTGQRLADILALTEANYDGHTITITQAKTRHHKDPVTLYLPVHAALRAELAATKTASNVLPTPNRKLCVRADGQPWTIGHFKHSFAAKRRELGLPEDLHFHGLRATLATHMAEESASMHEIKSFTGHKTDAMVARYTRQAEQKKLARAYYNRQRRRTKISKNDAG